MSEDSKLDIIIDKLNDAKTAREAQSQKLGEVAEAQAEHFAEDRAFMRETREAAEALAERVTKIEQGREWWTSGLWRAVLTAVIGGLVLAGLARFFFGK